VTAPGLAAETILRFPPGRGVRAAVDRVFGEAPGAAEIADLTVMAKLVRAGFGTTLMPPSAINGIDSGTLAVPVDDAR
jgi:DNA-binding transcriptional LysR family regulator